MKFTLACTLLATSAAAKIVSSATQSLDDTYNRVVSNQKITHCDSASFVHSIQTKDEPTIYGLDCDNENRRLSSSGSEDLSSQSFASYEEGAILTVVPKLKEEHLGDVHEVLVNFGGEDVLNEISTADLAENGNNNAMRLMSRPAICGGVKPFRLLM